jgi:hypothetical protein
MIAKAKRERFVLQRQVTSTSALLQKSFSTLVGSNCLSHKPCFMEIKGLSLRILRYLAKRSHFPLVYGTICMDLGMTKWEECAELSKVLIENNLAKNEGHKIWITQKGNDLLDAMNKADDDEIYKTLFDHDYYFTLLKFIYEKNEPFNVDELPKLLIENCPNLNNHTNEYELIRQFEFDKMKKYVTRIGTNWYEINETGKRYYEHSDYYQNKLG